VLLARAAPQFQVFLTVDRNPRFQQDIDALPLAAVAFAVPNNRIETLAPVAPPLLAFLKTPPERGIGPGGATPNPSPGF
jgi:hypothetical protein